MNNLTITEQAVMKALGSMFASYAAADAGGSPYPAMQKAQTVGAPISPYLHGPGGLFGVLGLERPVFSTHINITGSLGEMIPVIGGSDLENPLFPYITGFVRSDQQEKDGVCDDPEEAGNMKTCILTTVWGRKEFKTRQAEINRIGRRRNRGEFDDLQIENSPLVRQMGGIIRQQFALDNRSSLRAGAEMTARILEMGVAFQRWVCPQVFTGNPANSSAGGGYKEFMGLDLLISRNKPDAISGAQCESLYSFLPDYAYNDVQDTNAPYNIVHVFTHIFRYLRRKAEQQNFAPVQWAIVMRAQAFDAIADVWACEYAAYNCQFSAQSGNAGGNLTVNDMGPVTFRDDMRNNRYLLVDGVRVPVILDDCITEQTTADDANVPNGSYMSDIYFVPMSARGGNTRTLYWEFYDYNEDVLPAARDARALPFFFSSDGGRFLWSIKSPDNWCLEMIAKMEPRLILRTPQLAARLQNVVYTPGLVHFDDPLPSQDYWLDGGNPSGYPAPSPYSEYNLAGPGGQ